MTDQEARLVAALTEALLILSEEGYIEPHWTRPQAEELARAALTVREVHDLAADLALAAAVQADNEVEPPSEAIWRDLPQSRQEGFWFTEDSLAAALHRWECLGEPCTIGGSHAASAAAIIQAAKEAERG